MNSTMSAIVPIDVSKNDPNRIIDPKEYRKEKERLDHFHGIKHQMFATKREMSKRNDKTSIKKYLEVSAYKFMDKKYVIFSEVFNDYHYWADHSGYVPASITKFSKDISDLGYKTHTYSPKTDMPEYIKEKYGSKYRRKVITNFKEMQKSYPPAPVEVKLKEIDNKKFESDIENFIANDCKNSEKYSQKTALFAYFVIKHPEYKDADIDEFSNIFEKNGYHSIIKKTTKGIKVRAIDGIVTNYEATLEMQDSGMVKDYEVSKAKNMQERVKEMKIKLISNLKEKEEEKKSNLNKDNGNIDNPLTMFDKVKPINAAVVIKKKNDIEKQDIETDNIPASQYISIKANNLSDELNRNIEYIRFKTLENLIHDLRHIKITEELMAKMFYESRVLRFINSINNGKTAKEINEAYNKFVKEKEEVESYHK